MYLKQIEVGLMQNFNYLIGDESTKECAYIDPAFEVDRVLKIAAEDGYKVTKVFLTHQHFDHTDGVPEVFEKTSAKIYIHEADFDYVDFGNIPVEKIVEGNSFQIGKITFKVIHTPGHTPGSVCYHITSEDDPIGHLFTGDTLFQGNCGRSDLPGGDSKILFQSLNRIKNFEPTLKVYPGHDYGIKPVTTIAYEKAHNPTLKVKTIQEFDVLP